MAPPLKSSVTPSDYAARLERRFCGLFSQAMNNAADVATTKCIDQILRRMRDPNKTQRLAGAMVAVKTIARLTEAIEQLSDAELHDDQNSEHR